MAAALALSAVGCHYTPETTVTVRDPSAVRVEIDAGKGLRAFLDPGSPTGAATSTSNAGPGASDAECVQKLLREMESKEGNQRQARFVCVLAIAREERALAVVSDFAEGMIASAPRGTNGFGYDPVFCFSDTSRTYAEVSPQEKNLLSHRAKAFRKLREGFYGVNFSLLL